MKTNLVAPLALLLRTMVALTLISATTVRADQVDNVEFTQSGHYPQTIYISLSTTTTGTTIFYRTNGLACPADPTHSGSTPTGGTQVYTGTPIPVAAGTVRYITAVAYKAGMTDSVILCYQADNSGM